MNRAPPSPRMEGDRVHPMGTDRVVSVQPSVVVTSWVSQMASSGRPCPWMWPR